MELVYSSQRLANLCKRSDKRLENVYTKVSTSLRGPLDQIGDSIHALLPKLPPTNGCIETSDNCVHGAPLATVLDVSATLYRATHYVDKNELNSGVLEPLTKALSRLEGSIRFVRDQALILLQNQTETPWHTVYNNMTILNNMLGRKRQEQHTIRSLMRELRQRFHPDVDGNDQWNFARKPVVSALSLSGTRGLDDTTLKSVTQNSIYLQRGVEPLRLREPNVGIENIATTSSQVADLTSADLQFDFDAEMRKQLEQQIREAVFADVPASAVVSTACQNLHDIAQ